MLNYRGKNSSCKSEKNAFYKKKDAFYRKKSGFNTGVAIIVGLVFLVGIMMGLIIEGDKNPLKSQSAFNNSQDKATSNANKKNNTSNLEQVPELGETTITDAEIATIKQIIGNDKTDLFKLVNKDNLLSEDYMPSNLVTPNISLVTARENERNLVRSDIVGDLEQMFYDAQEEGINLFLSNGFRGVNEQQYLHAEDTDGDGSENSQYVAKPGESEHQTGIAIDITSRDMKFELDESFENTKEGAWALENSYKYGFILRYTKTKEHITGYKYEPWHYRYIGDKTISKLCYDNDLTLEELINYASGNN